MIANGQFFNSQPQGISFMGEEEFYTPLVVVIVWVLDAKLGRQLALLMALGFYITGFLKNSLCLPRPPSPPITPIERCNDWSLPSHHAVLGASIPWYIWFYTSLNYPLTPPFNIALFIVIAVWSFSVMFSRMYLGVHSPADILTGGVIGCLLLALWLQVDDIVDSYTTSGSLSLLIIPIAIFFVCLHPDPQPTTVIFTETVCMVSVATGVILGHSHAPNYILYASIERSDAYASFMSMVACCLTRFLLGFAMLMVVKTLSKIAAQMALSCVLQLGGLHTVYIKKQSAVTSDKVHYSPTFTVADQEVGDSSYWAQS